MNKYHIKILLLSVYTAFMAANPLAISQPEINNTEPEAGKGLAREANIAFEKSDFKKAGELYKNLIKTDSENSLFNYRLGICCFNSASEKHKSIRFFEKAAESYNTESDSIYNIKNDSVPNEVFYYLAKAYHLNNQFDKATDQYRICKYFAGKELANAKIIKQEVISVLNYEILRCDYGKQLMSKPVNTILIENLGGEVNTIYPEYAPIIRKDGTLVFTSRREGSTGGRKDKDGKYFEDIYFSYVEVGISSSKFVTESMQKFSTNINSRSHEAAIQFSSDGRKLYLYKGGGIYSSTFNDNGKWSKPEKVKRDEKNVIAFEPSVTISSDEQTLFLSSDRKGGYGGLDIYKCVRTKNGLWGPVKNLGPVINSPYDDDAPFIDKEGKTLYFSSKGHNSGGGYDIFKSNLINNDSLNLNSNWSRPVNLGYPINTGADDIYFMLSPNGERAYYASNKLEGFGEMDIYRITFQENKNSKKEVLKNKKSVIDSP